MPVENTTSLESEKCSATRAGTIVFVAQVRSVRSTVPNFRPARNRTFGQRGSAAICAGIEEIAHDRLDAVGFERLARGRRREAGCRDDAHAPPASRDGLLDSARERRSHLAAGADDQHVAIETAGKREVGVRGFGERGLELALGVDAFG